MPGKKKIEFKNIDSNTAEIMFYGVIGSEENQIDDAAFVQCFKDCEKFHNNINIRFNSPGGDIFKGIAIFNCIKNSTANTNAYIDGYAASMAGICALACNNIYMSNNARFMIHRASGQAIGDVDDIRSYADLMDSLQNDLAGIISKRTGIKQDEVKTKWMQHGVDSWLTAHEALDAKLINGIYDGPTVNAPSNSINDTAEIFKFYNKLNQNENMKNLAKFVALFALANIQLPTDASEEIILNNMQKLVDTNKELGDKLNASEKKLTEFENKAKVAHEIRVKNLVERAITDGKITADLKETYTTMATANFEATEKALGAMTAYVPAYGQLKPGNGAEKDARKEWSFTDWTKKDPKGLQEMKEKNLDTFKSLFKAEYNTEYKG